MADDSIIIKVSLDGAKEEIGKLEKIQLEISKLAAEKRKLSKQEKELTKTIQNGNKLKGDEIAQLKAVSEQQVKNNADLKISRKSYSDNERQVIANTKAQKENEGSLVQLRAQLSKDTFAYDRLTKAERENVNVGGKLRTSIKKQSDALKKLEDQTGRNQRSVGNYKKSFGSLRSLMIKGLGALGITAGLAGLVNVMKGAVKVAKDFEQGNANLASVLGKSRKEIGKLTDDAKRLGATTSFTASEVSKLQTEFAKLGFNEKEILNATEATLDLAAATGADLKDAAAIAGATLGGFGLDAKETQRITDVMAKSFSTSALDMEKFKESMKLAAPAARAVGVSVEETTSLLGTLANAGISGSNAGTALRKTFIELNDAGLTLDEALEQVATSEDQLGAATDLVGKKAATSFLILANGTDTTKELEKGLNNAGGAAKKMADEQLDTLEGKTKILGSAWEGLVLSLLAGDGAFSRISKSIVEGVTGLLGFVTAGEDANKVSFESAKANRALADSSQELLNEYEDLVTKGIEPTKEEKERLDIITLQLRNSLGESVVAINEETGAFELNTDAVKEQIKSKRFASDQEAATLASRLKGVQEEIKTQERTIKIQSKVKATAEVQRKKDIEAENARIKAAGKGESKLFKLSKDAQRTNAVRNKAADEEQKANEILAKQKELEIELTEKLKELNFTVADADALFATEKAKSDKEKEDSSKRIIDTTNKEKDAVTGLLTEQKKLKEIAEDLPELTEAEIAAKNRKIKTIDTEISRLKDLGKTEDELNKDKAELIDDEIEDLKLVRQLELATIDETNAEKIEKERALLDTIGALRVEKAKLNGEDVARVELENKIAKAEQEKEFDAQIEEEAEVKSEETKESQKELDNQKIENDKFLANQSIDIAAEGAKALLAGAEAKANREKDIELASLNAKLQGGLISQADFEAKKNEIEQTAFKKKKKRDLGIIAIDLAKEIASINVSAAGNPANAFTLGGAGVAQSAVLTGIAIARSAIQAGVVASQKFAKGGIINGPSHAGGGVQLGNNQEGEGGEAIINTVSTKKFLPELSAINVAGGGVPLTNAAPNYSAVASKFANGGVTAGGSGSTLDINDLRQAFSETVGAIKVQNVASETTDTANRVQQIQDSASF